MDYKEIFQRFSKLNILIIGDVMVDAYMWGKVERISPEAPVPVCSIIKCEDRLGGAANVALNLAALGAKPILCTIIGRDKNGEVFLSLIEEKKLAKEGIISSYNRQTTAKTRILSGSSQMLRFDKETDSEISAEEEVFFLERIYGILASKRIDVIIFQDYDKGLITKNLIAKVVEKAQTMGIPIAVDPKKRNFNNYNGVTLFKPNMKELQEGLNMDCKNVNEEILIQAAKALNIQQKIEKVFITLSSQGVFIMDFSDKLPMPCYIPAHLRQIADVSGAGDTVISVASLCLALGIKAIDLAKISNLAGGLVCEKIGVVPVDKDILYRELIKIT